jgi:hypothetical protein
MVLPFLSVLPSSWSSTAGTNPSSLGESGDSVPASISPVTGARRVEKAYDEVTKYKLAPQFHNQVLKIGKAIADASEDSAAQRTWSQRNPIQ